MITRLHVKISFLFLMIVHLSFAQENSNDKKLRMILFRIIEKFNETEKHRVNDLKTYYIFLEEINFDTLQGKFKVGMYTDSCRNNFNKLLLSQANVYSINDVFVVVNKTDSNITRLFSDFGIMNPNKIKSLQEQLEGCDTIKRRDVFGVFIEYNHNLITATTWDDYPLFLLYPALEK